MFNTIVPVADWNRIRNQLINRAVIAIGIIGVIGCVASVARSTMIGFQPMMILHIACAVGMSLIAIFRRRCSLEFKTNIMLMMMLAIGLTGFLNWGLIGNSLLWLAMGGMLITLAYGTVWGISYGVLVSSLTVIIGWMFSNGNITLPINVNDYVNSTAAWVSALADISIMMVVLVALIGGVHDSARGLIERLAEKNRQIATLADTDTLTGLANVRVANDRLTHALALAQQREERVAVLFLDLNNFKQFNDHLGHAAGDLVLQTVAQRLKTAVRRSDTAARIGGDEFLVVQELKNKDFDRKHTIERIKQKLEQPIELPGEVLDIKVSIGAAISQPLPAKADIQTVATRLIQTADAAMFADKSGGNPSSLSAAEKNERNEQRSVANHSAPDTFHLIEQPMLGV